MNRSRKFRSDRETGRGGAKVTLIHPPRPVEIDPSACVMVHVYV